MTDEHEDMSQQFIDQVNAAPIDPALFCDLAAMTVAVAEGRGDHPQAMMLVAQELNRRFDESTAAKLLHSFMFRWMALVIAVEDDRADDYMRQEGKTRMALHKAVYEAASECPLKSFGHFDDSFDFRINRIIAEGEIE